LALTFITALMIGLLGSVHCIGMCGGIVGALNIAPSAAQRDSRLNRLAHHLIYNSGRILSYMLIGALMGFIGAQTSRLSTEALLPIGGVIAGLFMIALGLYLAGWWYGIQVLERAGMRVWKIIEPLGRRFIPARTRLHVFGLGLVWGWLPCGLVYSALALAMVSASPVQGAWIMLGFGLGTLPMLLAMGHAAQYLRKIVRQPMVRRLVGTLIILFGVYTFVTAFSKKEHHHGAREHESAASVSATKSGLLSEVYAAVGSSLQRHQRAGMNSTPPTGCCLPWPVPQTAG